MTDAELVRQTRNGQASAYEVLVRRWSARLIAYSRAKVGNVEVAEDIAQDSLLKAYRSLHTLLEPERFGSWLLSIAHRNAIDWLKAKARDETQWNDHHEPGPQRSDRHPLHSMPPDDLCARNEQRQTVMEQIALLPETLRETLLLYYYQDFTYNELAQLLGVSTATINARLTKARKLLRQSARIHGVYDEM